MAAGSSLYAQAAAESNDIRALIEQGNQALAENRLRDAALAFQRAIDLNPSSAKAHEQLGVALTRVLLDANARPSADSDVSERAEENLQRAVELAPSATKPLMELSDLEALLAERGADPSARADRYEKAEQLLKQVLALNAGKTEIYIKLANLERDEFLPAIQQAKSRAAAKPGPLADSELRHALQQQYGALIDDAIANAQRASETNANSGKPMLLMSRLLETRALIRDTPEQYSADMHAAQDWERQFLSAGDHAAPGK